MIEFVRFFDRFFKKFFCSKVFLSSLVLVSIFGPSIFYKKVKEIFKVTITIFRDKEKRSQRGFFFVYLSLSIKPCQIYITRDHQKIDNKW